MSSLFGQEFGSSCRFKKPEQILLPPLPQVAAFADQISCLLPEDSLSHGERILAGRGA